MSFYDDMAATAAGMLAEFGQAVTISRTAPGAYDTATGTNGPPTVLSWTVAGLEEAYDSRLIDGTLILAGDRRLLVEPGPFAVEDAVIMADGTTGTVKAVTPFSPGGTALYVELRVRR
ncbi:hypothetical protein QO010_000374 [Caulobacter ginsengisoli]|uniref:Uncharacterized protein n=1 Tax=Caulobacter ginsengisoli TaxID=400775 RepID=A0ABU0IKT6_9CAUL|nr:hypothetical protein [Caulobacter ginsengisoli]MDQ0462626.1 hypothetical protein [Caulobacter ginsengisoli]